jgi:hypothetical protein
VLQRVRFAGPRGKGGDLVNKLYPGYDFQLMDAVRPNTGCGSRNRITTDGSELNDGDSRAGTPQDMKLFRDGFDRGGGLVRDKNQNLDQAATKMHMINHRLGKKGDTQGTESNIFLGTQKSNNPTHFNEVEKVVISSLTERHTKNNLAYEKAMDKAVEVKNAGGQNFLFWPKADKPGPSVLKKDNLVQVWRLAGGNGRSIAKNQQGAADKAGWALSLDADTPEHNYHHLWLRYQVTANYPGGFNGIPQYVRDNVDHEEAQNNARRGGPDPDISKAIAAFRKFWAHNAFPTSFLSEVAYYSATYKAETGIYRRESEAHEIKADL